MTRKLTRTDLEKAAANPRNPFHTYAREELRKGDSEGHPFRGNQWKGGTSDRGVPQGRPAKGSGGKEQYAAHSKALSGARVYAQARFGGKMANPSVHYEKGTDSHYYTLGRDAVWRHAGQGSYGNMSYGSHPGGIGGFSSGARNVDASGERIVSSRLVDKLNNDLGSARARDLNAQIHDEKNGFFVEKA